MADQSAINDSLVAEVQELKLMAVSLAAYIGSLPGAADPDITGRARTLAAMLIDPSDDRIGGDQIARVMHHVQNLFRAASTLK